MAASSILPPNLTKKYSLFAIAPDLSRFSIPAFQISHRRHSNTKLVIQAAGSTYGNIFRVTTYGESHGGGVGCVIDGCPPRIPISEADIQFELDRRRPGQSRITAPRKETDSCKIYSGIADGLTTGAPIHVSVPNTDYRSSGGGRSSARETIGRVAGGAIAKKILKLHSGTEVLAYVSQVHKVVLTKEINNELLTLDQGLGSPVFDKLEAELAKAALSLPASKGFEIGSSFGGTFLTGSEHNDEFYTDEHGRVRTRTNRSGGIQGGISNGETIEMRIGFKPTPTISIKQRTVTRDKQETDLVFRGRQEPCVAPRAVPVVESMVAIVLVDQLMAQHAQCQLFPINPEFQEPSSRKLETTAAY